LCGQGRGTQRAFGAFDDFRQCLRAVQ